MKCTQHAPPVLCNMKVRDITKKYSPRTGRNRMQGLLSVRLIQTAIFKLHIHMTLTQGREFNKLYIGCANQTHTGSHTGGQLHVHMTLTSQGRMKVKDLTIRYCTSAMQKSSIRRANQTHTSGHLELNIHMTLSQGQYSSSRI